MSDEIVIETLDIGRHSLPADRIRRLYLPMAREKLKRLVGE